MTQESADGDFGVSSTDNPKMTVNVIEETGYEAVDDNGVVTDGLDDAGPIGGKIANGNNRLSYHFGLIILTIGILYGLSHFLSAKHIIKVVVHRRIWNVILLVSTIITALLGLFLILRIDFGIYISLPINSLFWHVEAGIVMGLIAVFHIIWHWRYFQKMLNPAS